MIYEEFAKKVQQILVDDASLPRLHAWQNYMQKCLSHVQQQESGLFLEFGVAGGTSINFIAQRLPNHTIYGFDSFQGLHEDWGILKKGKFAEKNIPKCRENVQLIPGLFENTLVPFLREHLDDTAAFVHVDCDLYSAASFVLEKLEPFITSGTILCFDEIWSNTNPIISKACEDGEFKAFSEFIERSGFSYELLYSFNMAACIRII